MKKRYTCMLACFLGLQLGSTHLAAEFKWEDYYKIETVAVDENIDPQFGGVDINANGELVACFHRGEVAVYNEKSKQWRVIASGLHEPLGLYVEEEGTILVVQRAELTRLHDKDKDGIIDFYEVVCNDWGVSGNYHEFTFGLAKDSQNNIFIALGTASNGSGVRERIRGPWNDTGGLKHDDFLYGGEHGDWSEKKKKAPRMYARVPYRGCVLKIKPNSMKAEVYATGVRTPNGIYVDANDQVWVSDNQGDWVGSSKLHRIEKGGFHGHPASLLWAENPPNEIPSKMPIKKLDEMRIKASALVPQGDAGNSITQMIALEQGFIPMNINPKHAGQMLIGEMNHARLLRYFPDVVNDKTQGAVTHFMNTPALNHGNNRLVFSEDNKTLYVGKTHLSWPGRKGLKKITYTGKPFLATESVSLTPKGFKFTFNSKIEGAADLSSYNIDSYGTDYHASYGSQKVNLAEEPIAKVVIEGNTLSIELKEPIKAGRVYDIQLPKGISSNLSALSSTRYWYTAHKVH